MQSLNRKSHWEENRKGLQHRGTHCEGRQKKRVLAGQDEAQVWELWPYTRGGKGVQNPYRYRVVEVKKHVLSKLKSGWVVR